MADGDFKYELGYEDVWKGSQGVFYEGIFEVKSQRAMTISWNTYKVELERDSYDKQSKAKLSQLTKQGWETIIWRSGNGLPELLEVNQYADPEDARPGLAAARNALLDRLETILTIWA